MIHLAVLDVVRMENLVPKGSMGNWLDQIKLDFFLKKRGFK